MKKTTYFDAKKYIDEIIEAMRLDELDSDTLSGIKARIEEKLAERVVLTMFDHFGSREAEQFERLMEDHPELNEMDGLILVSKDIPGLKEALEKQLDNLHDELVYDADAVEKAMIKVK